MSRPGYPKSATEYENARFNFVSPAGVVEPYTLDLPYISMKADRVGANSPGWPHFRQENAYGAYIDKRKYSLSHFHSSNSSSGWHGEGSYPFSLVCRVSDPNSLWTDETNRLDQAAVNHCVNTLIERVKDQKVNVMVAAAEFNKTCGTVADATRRLASAYSSVRKGNIGSALNILGGGRSGTGSGGSGGRKKPHIPPNSGSAAKDWLAIQYGWKPLIKDVYGSCEELARSLTYREPAKRVSAKGGLMNTLVFDIEPASSTQPRCRGTCKIQYTYKGAIEYGVGSQLASFATNTGITNPAAVIWELIPYSFVVDWFLPVGNYLNNLDYNNGLIFNKGHITIKAQVALKVESIGGTFSSGPEVQTWSGGSLVQSVEAFRRDILGGFPDVPPPQFKDPRSLIHALNGIALLRVAFAGGSRYR